MHIHPVLQEVRIQRDRKATIGHLISVYGWVLEHCGPITKLNIDLGDHTQSVWVVASRYQGDVSRPKLEVVVEDTSQGTAVVAFKDDNGNFVRCFSNYAEASRIFLSAGTRAMGD